MHLDALGCTGLHWCAFGCIEMHWDILECIGMHWDALDCFEEREPLLICYFECNKEELKGKEKGNRRKESDNLKADVITESWFSCFFYLEVGKSTFFFVFMDGI